MIIFIPSALVVHHSLSLANLSIFLLGGLRLERLGTGECFPVTKPSCRHDNRCEDDKPLLIRAHRLFHEFVTQELLDATRKFNFLLYFAGIFTSLCPAFVTTTEQLDINEAWRGHVQPNT